MAVRADVVMLAGGCALRRLGVSCCVIPELGDDIGFSYRGGGWRRYGGGGSMIPFGTPGMGLLMVPLGIGVCLLFTGTYKRWANLLIWGSVAALGVGVLNSIRLTFMPTTLWALSTYIVMIAAGGGLMFRSLGGYDDKRDDDDDDKPGNGAD
jgi:hypothetical protein